MLGLEQAIDKAREIIEKAGYPVTFAQVEDTKRNSLGGWDITYRVLLGPRRVKVELDQQGDLFALTTQEITTSGRPS